MSHIRRIPTFNSVVRGGLRGDSSARGAFSHRPAKATIGSIAIPSILTIALGFSTLFLPGLTTYAVEHNTGSTDSISLSIEMQCSFMTKGSASAADGNYQATGANGAEANFADGSTRTFNIACNQISGYTVSAYATALTREEGGDESIAFVDYANYGSSKAANPGVGIWSAQLTDADEGATFGTQASPSIIKHTNAASNVNGDEFSVNYMAYIGRTTTSGTYSGEAVYQLTMNPINPTSYTYYVIYNANGIANTPTPQTGETDVNHDTTVTLSNNLPSITVDDTTYTALGWDTSPTATTVVYSAGETITIPETSPVLNLYAVWAQGTEFWTVAYDANGGTMTQTMTPAFSPDASDVKVTLTNIIPTRANYYFAGWSKNADATTATYRPGDSFTLTSSNSEITLYAVWAMENSVMANGNYMQTMTADSCANVQKYSVSGITYQLIDSRDGHSYLVRKLDDGNCWMVQNLSLFARTPISTRDTDLNSDAISANFISKWNSATSVSAGASQWTNTATKYQVYNGTYRANTKNTTVSSNNTLTANTGSYYPYIVATAGYDTTKTSGQAGNSSICPKGWKLPTGGSSGQFQALYTAYSSNSSNFQSAMNINSAYPGYCNSSYCPYANSYILLWSSTIHSATNGYYLNADSSGVSPTWNYSKYYGLSVRCVLGS